MNQVRVSLAERAYNIFIGAGLLDHVAEHLPGDGFEKAALITDANVAPLYGDRLSDVLERARLEVVRVEIEPGETSKTTAKALEVLEFLIESRFTRTDLVVVLGGGVVGDLAGFVASVFKRGIRFLQVPTTLMSQVDSAIGGKTGVNLLSGKNMVGTFHQPIAVVCDIDTLRTLMEREFSSGLAEVAKYRFLDPGRWPEPIAEAVQPLKARESSVLSSAVTRCCEMKAEVVSRDERDTGTRAILNYGHTLGHALESATGYSGEYTHGEAVSIGMIYAAFVAERTGVSSPGQASRHRTTLELLGLPTSPFDPAPSFSVLLEAMAQDKKSLGDLTMVLLAGEGHPIVKRGLDEAVLRSCYENLLEGA